jgi:hypothetical protein
MINHKSLSSYEPEDSSNPLPNMPPHPVQSTIRENVKETSSEKDILKKQKPHEV